MGTAAASIRPVPDIADDLGEKRENARCWAEGTLAKADGRNHSGCVAPATR
jgi:hypothetical protein